ncbi:plasmid partitioning protein RepB [Brucella anthropi]|uniref:plasmid partitioning protein RepB n=1 Tax=Brucella anthropi TaxID=529 RepID=UPI00124EB264|nr:plasmid partitioning protein RepB [Brucella anthropi]KAB2784737.1 plasmid partitioning protein RepB [Brucella anthropi]
MSRKDSRSIFANLVKPQEQTGDMTPAASPSPHLRKVAAGLRQLHEREETFAKILKDGDRIIDIDVNDIAPSQIQDRFDGSYEEAAIAEIVESMRERGQIVPGLVRPLDDGTHHYQIVFGRRRWNAAKQLGLPFRAVIKELTDEQAIVFQGEENTNREDLSFLEKCLFAHEQEAAGFRRDVICASLSTTKSHLSEMLRITTTVPKSTLLLIGRAPDTGRRRWLEFCELWNARSNAQLLVQQALTSSPSDRFQAAVAALKQPDLKQVTQESKVQREIRANGELLATIARSKAGSRLSFQKNVPQGFVDFLAERMPELHAQYLINEKEG